MTSYQKVHNFTLAVSKRILWKDVNFIYCCTYEVRKSQQCHGTGSGFWFCPTRTASPGFQVLNKQQAFDLIAGNFKISNNWSEILPRHIWCRTCTTRWLCESHEIWKSLIKKVITLNLKECYHKRRKRYFTCFTI